MAGFTSAIKSAVNQMDELSKAAQRVGVSTEVFSSLNYAAKLADVSTQDLQSTLGKLTKNMSMAQYATSQQSQVFKALGIATTDANGSLRSSVEVLKEFSDRFKQLKGDPDAIAAGMLLFGKSFQNVIPLLKDGAQGLSDAQAEADKLNQTISGEAGKAAEQFNDNITRLQSVSLGFFNVLATKLLPELDAWSDEVVDLASDHDKMNTAVSGITNTLEGIAAVGHTVAASFKFISAGIQSVAVTAASVTIQLSLLKDSLSHPFDADALKADNAKALADVENLKSSLTDIWSSAADGIDASFDAAGKNLARIRGELVDFPKQQAASGAGNFIDDVFGTDEEADKKAEAIRSALHKAFADPTGTGAAAAKKSIDAATKALDAYQKKMEELSAKSADAVSSYIGKDVTPDVKAWNDYADVVRKVAEAEGARIQTAIAAQKQGLKGANVAEVEASAQRDMVAALEKLAPARDAAAAAAQKEMDTSGKQIAQLQQQVAMAGLSARDQFIVTNGIQAETAYREKNANATEAQIAAQRQLVEVAAANAYDMTQYAQQQNAIAQEYAGFWENAASSISKSFGDLITGQTRSWKDFGQSLKSVAQQFVSDIISQFVRLKILGPLLSGAMGSVAGWLGIAGSLGGSSITQAAQYYGGGSTIGETAGSVGGANSYGGMLSNLSTMKSLYSYMFGGSSTVGVPVTSATTSQVAIGANAFTPASYYGGMSPSIGGYAAPYASVAGGLAGAYYGSRQGDGSWGTAGSTVAYGALGAGIAGTAAGVAGGMGVGAAAGGAFGAAAGMSWIPIVGWIAALAAVVDKVSGGKVFGTKYRTDASAVDLNIGADGASADASVHQWKYRSQLSQAFGRFGGILLPSDWGDKDKRQKNAEVTPEMTAAAKALYDNIEKTMVTGAQRLAVDVPAMIEATLSAQSTYDKKGKLKTTDYVVEYLGRTWKEATADAAAQRLGAEALVKVVEASAGAVAQSIAEQFRDSAETLLDGAQLMVAAQADIQRGNSLLALGATATLGQVVAFAQTMQADGEALADTYNRLVQASAAYLQFVGQFAPANNTFGGSLQAIAKQMQANIDQANALAQAAGLQHAKESDLANIHQFAAHAAAEAIAQLSSAAQDLAAKLYDVTGSSLNAVNALLDKMSGKVQTAAQLAIGDNSPLNDKQKLDVALQGLRSGVTSADDVLNLGRKLYSSSADYTGLFNKVQEILGLPGAGESGIGGISDALKEYNALIGKRDQYASQAEAMTRFNDAKTLAQYVADISTTHGIGYGEAASGLGFSLQDLAKDLGVTNLAGYLDNLKLADIPGTTMDASASIVDAIRQLGRDLIQTISGGPLVTPGPANKTQAAETDPEIRALLSSIDQRLANLEDPISQTAKTNTQMVKQGAGDSLNRIASSARSLA